jgi:hypothetical protein
LGCAVLISHFTHVFDKRDQHAYINAALLVKRDYVVSFIERFRVHLLVINLLKSLFANVFALVFGSTKIVIYLQIVPDFVNKVAHLLLGRVTAAPSLLHGLLHCGSRAFTTSL